MSESDPKPLEDTFLESKDNTLHLIAEFKKTKLKARAEGEVREVADKLREDGHLIEDVRLDEGVTPFVIIELALTNIEYESLVNICTELVEIKGLKGITVSTTEVGGIERFKDKR